MNYTKGEWKAHGIVIVDKDGFEIATVQTKHAEGEAKANTNLISAAPEMYEALKQIVTRIESKDGVVRCGLQAIGQVGMLNALIHESKQALAKIEGK